MKYIYLILAISFMASCKDDEPTKPVDNPNEIAISDSTIQGITWYDLRQSMTGMPIRRKSVSSVTIGSDNMFISIDSSFTYYSNTDSVINIHVDKTEQPYKFYSIDGDTFVRISKYAVREYKIEKNSHDKDWLYITMNGDKKDFVKRNLIER